MTEIRFFSGFSVEMFPLSSLVIEIETVEPGITSGHRLAKAIGPMNGQRYCVCAVLITRCYAVGAASQQSQANENIILIAMSIDTDNK